MLSHFGQTFGTIFELKQKTIFELKQKTKKNMTRSQFKIVDWNHQKNEWYQYELDSSGQALPRKARKLDKSMEVKWLLFLAKAISNPEARDTFGNGITNTKA